ncbi:hypothetical protein CC80DRAFT_490127 [Byssothecium circinans]|uniref:Uncharacterized protein n=1 Tax=Byssothecium circinans TaxID=147558 RepID=A0A6A5U8E6_9PLEO|nr:hypothetical protein CC80DRAFT_490127 [Byssothecium circinans]
MAEVVAFGQDTSQFQRQHHAHAAAAAPHGKKRAADSSLESEQRLSKRFDLLNIVDNNGTRLYIPVAGSSDAAAKPTAPVKPIPVPATPATRKKREKAPRPAPAADDHMQVEDTPHRVYIHDLSAELSDLESDEETPIYLSDIEKHLAKIPKHVLLGPEPKEPEPTLDNQVVLYNVPSSLSVPEAQDSVRKAIVETRARLREKQANWLVEPERASATPEIPATSADPDAMDID